MGFLQSLKEDKKKNYKEKRSVISCWVLVFASKEGLLSDFSKLLLELLYRLLIATALLEAWICTNAIDRWRRRMNGY